MSYIVIDHVLHFSSINDTKDEVIEGCGYELDEVTFDELLKKVEGIYEIIEIKGDCTWLTN
jgi:hypothetical protein